MITQSRDIDHSGWQILQAHGADLLARYEMPEGQLKPATPEQRQKLKAQPFFWGVYAPDIDDARVLYSNDGKEMGYAVVYELQEIPKKPGIYYCYDRATAIAYTPAERATST